MTRQQVAFLFAGIVLGFVLGFVTAWGIDHAPTAPPMPAPGSSTSMPAAAAEPLAAPDGNAVMEEVQSRITDFKARLQSNPDDVEALQGLADMYMQVSMYSQAEEYLLRAVELLPEDPHVRTHLGIVLGQVGDLEGARQEFERVVSRQPEDWKGWLYLAVTAARQGDLERAEVATDRLEALNPTLPQIAEIRRSLVEQSGASQ